MNRTKTAALSLVALALSTLSLTSCQKTYQCHCTMDFTNVYTTHQIHFVIKAGNREKATEKCSAKNIPTYSKVCTIQ